MKSFDAEKSDTRVKIYHPILMKFCVTARQPILSTGYQYLYLSMAVQTLKKHQPVKLIEKHFPCHDIDIKPL